MIELTPKEINRREELTFKLRDGKITYEEAEELKQILEREKEKAISLNDIVALIAIGFFLAAVIGFLSEMDKKGKKKKKSK
jgi:hypothetical protein